MSSIAHTLAHLFHPRRSNNHRPRVLHPEALFFFVLIVMGFYTLVHSFSVVTPQTGAILGYASNISAQQVVEQTNAQRAAAGLSPLAMNDQLSNAAAGKARDMFTNQYWAHTSPSGLEPWDFMRGAGYRYKIAGENLARDFMTTPDMIGAWMASPTHKANMVNPRFTQIGVAVVNGVLEGTETTLVVQMFGLPASAVIAQAPAISVEGVANDQATAKTAEEPNSGIPQTQQGAEEDAALLPQNPTQPEPADSQPEPVVVIEPVTTLEQGSAELSDSPVLSRFLVSSGSLLPTIVMSPLQLLKAFFLAVVLLLMTVLVYDLAIMGHRQQMRLVGKNIAHLMLFLAVAFLLIFFKGGVIG